MISELRTVSTTEIKFQCARSVEDSHAGSHGESSFNRGKTMRMTGCPESWVWEIEIGL